MSFSENILIIELKERIKELEDRVEALKISRRVLLKLIDTVEKEKKVYVTKLENDNQKLQKNNQKYAKMLLNSNSRVCLLEAELNRYLLKESNTYTSK